MIEMHRVISALKQIARSNREIRAGAGGDLTRFVSLRHQLDSACSHFLTCLGGAPANHEHRALVIRLRDHFLQMRQTLADHQRGWTLAEVICLPEDYAVSADRVNERIIAFIESSLGLIAATDGPALPRNQAG